MCFPCLFFFFPLLIHGCCLLGSVRGSVLCGLTEIKPKQTSFSPCPNLLPLYFVIPFLPAPLSSRFCSAFQRKQQPSGHPEQNSSPKLSDCSAGRPAAVSAGCSGKKKQAWLSWDCFISPLPSALSYRLSSCLPRWKRAEPVARAACLGLHLEGFIREESKVQQGEGGRASEQA